jgi:Flp pilus assembly protein TadD
MSHVAHPLSHVHLAIRRVAPALAAVSMSLLLSACASTGGTNPLTASDDTPLAKYTAAEAAANPQTELQKATSYWGKQHAENPRDPRAAVNYARNLKAMGAKKEALVILQEAHTSNTTDREINSEYGRLALEHDQLTTAQKLLEQADDPTKPDWRVISARGTVLAKQSKNAEAIPFFQKAHEIAPEQSSVLNNLAMAHAMNGQPDKAEVLLRQAVAKGDGDPRVAQNLALVLGLQGKHDDAKAVAGSSGTSESTTHNTDVLRQMVQTDEPPQPVSAPARAMPAAKKSTASITKSAPVVTGATGPVSTSKGKAKAKPDASAEVDPAELVRRLADGDTTAGKAP